jgi:hypothetical protein
VKAEDIKREYDRSRLIDLARREGLDTAPGRIQCPHRCSDERRGCSVGETGNGAMWDCKRCGKGGSAIDLVMASRNMNVVEAVEYLAGQLGSLPPPAAPKPTVDVKGLWRSMAPTDELGLEYLKSRGLDKAADMGLVRFNVGGLGHNPRCRTACAACWLDDKANLGMRVAVPLYGIDGTLASFQLRSVAPGVDSRMAKMSLAGVTYPTGGVAFGDVGQSREHGRIFLAEGMADTLALLVAGVRAIGAPGTESIKHLVGFLGDVAGRIAIVCPQNDADRIAKRAAERKAQGLPVHDVLSSEAAFRNAADTLHIAGATVLTLKTPNDHKDPADWLKYVGREQFRAKLDEVRPLDGGQLELPAGVGGGGAAPRLSVVAMPGSSPLPVIVNRPNEKHVTFDDTMRVLRGDPDLFERGRRLVRIAHAQKEPPAIVELPRDSLGIRISALARHMRLRKKDNIPVPDEPMVDVVRAIYSHTEWGLRPLVGLTECPVIRPDGSILDVPGYDPDTGLWFEPSTTFLPVAGNPTREDAMRAATFIVDEMVCDFPFQTSAHMSAWLAAFLTPLARPAIDGNVPMFGIDANSRGSGKGMLVDLIAVVVLGRKLSPTASTGNDEEWRKRISSVALGGRPMVSLDNVKRRLDSEALEMAITSQGSADRLLGKMQEVEAPLRCVWFATGNNLQMSPDLVRRTIYIRLESRTEKPEERTDFKKADLIGWAKDNRAQLLHAGLTVLRAYIVAGKPSDAKTRALGSFEKWAELVRGAVIWVGFPDPCATRGELATADSETNLLRRLISAWEEELGLGEFSLREVCRQFENESEGARVTKTAPKFGPLYDVFVEIRPPIGGVFDVARLAYTFRKFKGRVIEGKRLECETDRNGIAKWRIAGDRSDAGDARP